MTKNNNIEIEYDWIRRNNSVYKNWKNFMSDYYFDNLMIVILEIKENENSKFNDKIELIKRLKNDVGTGLKESKDFYDILNILGFFNGYYIEDSILEINSLKNIQYMIDNNLTIKHFLRKKKIETIINGIKY